MESADQAVAEVGAIFLSATQLLCLLCLFFVLFFSGIDLVNV